MKECGCPSSCRVFTSLFWGVKMQFVTQKMTVEVKYKKVSEKQLVASPVILKRHEGQLVETKRVMLNGELLEGFQYKLFREDGKEVQKNDIQYFQVTEAGTEQAVRPFSRTKIIKVVKEVPAASVDNFLIHSYYELFHKDEAETSALYEEALRYFKEDLAGICLFSWGNGFLQYYGVVAPVMQDGKFVWVMKLTQTKIQYQHMMDVPSQKTPVNEPPTLDVLPPVEAFITC